MGFVTEGLGLSLDMAVCLGKLLGFSEPQFTGTDSCRPDEGVLIVTWSGFVLSIRRSKGSGPTCALAPSHAGGKSPSWTKEEESVCGRARSVLHSQGASGGVGLS